MRTKRLADGQNAFLGELLTNFKSNV